MTLSPDEQRVALSTLAGRDRELAARVRELLDHDAASGDLAVLSALGALEQAGSEAQPGERLGAYRMVHSLATGGMGSVWLAERDDGSFQKQVAVKLIRGVERGIELLEDTLLELPEEEGEGAAKVKSALLELVEMQGPDEQIQRVRALLEISPNR